MAIANSPYTSSVMFRLPLLHNLTLALLQYIGRDGIVQSIRYCGDVVVRYPNTKLLQVNGDCLTQVKLACTLRTQ